MSSPVPDVAAAPAQTPSPLARLSGVSITHEDTSAATPRDVSFEIARGEVVLLLGPSGSGKSTLALALNGLIPHAVPAELTGRIETGGVDTATATVAQLSTRVGMVFQDPDAQLVTGTLLDEVAFGPENLRLPVEEVLRRAEAALRRVGLWERRHENPDRLSGGGRQRLAIAAALALGSPLLVLDEPTANLDPAGIEDVYAALADLIAAGDHGILLVEHNLDAAIGFVDRVVVLDQRGGLVADGPADATLRDRAEELHELGVWLPTATLAALRLRRAGYPLDPLPLTPKELRSALAPLPPATDAAPPRPRALPAAAPAVRVEHLTLRRGRTTVLHDVSLAVPAGSFTAIVGANGAGKTSLLQAIAGVVPPPRGTVHLGDADVARVDPRSLPGRIGFVFQNPEHQFVAHTVFDEAAQGLRRQRLGESEVRERASALLERFGLADSAERHPFLLSGGQKRRLSVGTALVAGAAVLALDEPTFGQDRARAEELLRLLASLNAEGTTVLVVTHDMQLVSEYADRMVVLEGGRVVAAGETGDVFDDEALIERAGLRLPPLRRALRGLSQHPSLASATRLADLPGADA